jgi:hypothetical protein
MRYTHVVCWVNRQERAELQQEHKKYPNIPLIFAKNYADFAQRITDTAYVVLSLKRARYRKTFDIVKAHPNIMFHAFYKMDGMLTTWAEFELFDEPNMSQGYPHPQYAPCEIFTEFCTG